jgi:hypothetical protein
MDMKAKTNLLLDSIIFLAFLVAFEPHITGTQIHEWLGAAFFLTLLAHLILHWKWVVNTLSKFFKKMTWSNRINFGVDFFVFLAFIVLNLSGLMISKFLLQSLGINVTGGGSWKQIHSLSADVTLYLVALHFALHWNWLVAAVKNHVIRPASGLFMGSRKLEPQPVRNDER